MKESNPDYNQFMEIALEEAKLSLREGNNGFGAVIAKDDTLIVRAHDTEETDADPTSHAELNAIRINRLLKLYLTHKIIYPVTLLSG